MKLKKTKKAIRMRGKGRGSHGWGARKKHMGSGHRGGKGMAGSGKISKHKKSYVDKKFEKYFGRSGSTSKKTEKNKLHVINLRNIQKDIESLNKKYLNKQGILELERYKILGDGEIDIKVNIKAKAYSQTAKEKIERAGGTITTIFTKEKDNK